MRNCQEIEAPGPLVFVRQNVHPIRYQAPEDDMRRKITQGGRGGGTKETEVTETESPPGSNRDLGAGRRHQMGDKWTQYLKAEAGKRRGRRDKRRSLASGGDARNPVGRRTMLVDEVGTG